MLCGKGHFSNITQNFESTKRKIFIFLTFILVCDLRYLWIVTSYTLVRRSPGSLFTKPLDVSDLMKFRNRKIWMWNCLIAVKYSRRLESIAAELQFTFHINTALQPHNLAATDFVRTNNDMWHLLVNNGLRMTMPMVMTILKMMTIAIVKVASHVSWFDSLNC